ncbi:ligase-associated DNA damage response DEXH box helicase [Panacibacter ginsenosidivorans]|uniref:Ligase-associated DNA damage response DEXH box helicase n=1 Tax=Panacibacter ginsenosidivorans TaxID=1813871 RepID=A0A5B8VE63_9BACT|nr:ligase-associated DNA damage response DEXH box helicase [Panacibacter ginsenosidivorans]QEC69807.1 ligase-associated DNA damage response DEXH box helicase [Panacibacter ginsenosidivorans]
MASLNRTKGFQIIKDWFTAKSFAPFSFQQETWQHILDGKSGLVNAPTGCGKTFSVFIGSVIQFINEHPDNYKTKSKNGLQLLWVTPLRALAKDIARAMEEVIAELGMQWKVGIRNGDTDTSERQKQKRNIPEVLLITPESLHLLLAQKGYPETFKDLRIIAVDEWHELLGSKRGVQVELAVSRIVNVVNGQLAIDNREGEKSKVKSQKKQISVWGISATIGNLEEAREVLLAPVNFEESVIVKANLHKRTEVYSIIPDEIEKYPWAGHLGIKLAAQIIPIIEASNTTLIFINTRGMSERWYQTILDIAPQLAGAIALHHGSIEQELRWWVEEALHTQKLKAVVCTASLDLGVDFRPVDTVIQVGSPKGVSRFLQRAGRSGHRPGDVSKIYFLPTHSLELVEAAALKEAIKDKVIESREPMLLCFDVLIQYLCTLAIGEGFRPEEIFEEVRSTYCFADIKESEWHEVIYHITSGGKALEHYDEYKKVEVIDGLYRIRNRRIAMRHRMHIGTIVSDAMMKVKFMSGGYIGVIEEWFISRLEPGDVFVFGGYNLEMVAIKDMTVLTRKSKSKKALVPSWMGGRMSLTANLGHVLRNTFNKIAANDLDEIELKSLQPLFELQKELSHIPQSDELLIEHIEDKDGYHLMVYPFEGRQVHEAMSSLMAYRISKATAITFSIAMNDYGFELLSDRPIPVDDTNVHELFTTENLITDIQKSVNSVEMATRKFRDIAVIGGLIFQGFPGEQKKARHLQSSAGLLFKVFSEYDPHNILLRQAYQEVFDQQMEEVRLRNALQRIQNSRIVIMFPQQFTPLSFPIIVDGLSRYNLSSERLEDRIRRMQQQLEN